MKKIVLGLSLVLMILVSGCLTLSVDSKVNKEGEIVQCHMIIDTNSYVYSILNSEASEDGETLRESIISQGGEYEEVWDGDDVKITIKGLPPENAYTEKSEEYLIYRDSIGDSASDYQNGVQAPFRMSEAMDSAMKIHYYLEMPGEIVDSNADFVDGNKAEWHMVTLSSIRDVYAKSEVPSLPGIELFGAVCMLLVTALFVKQ